MHLKLDELIRAAGGARNTMIDLERMSDAELKKLQAQFKRIGQKAGQTSQRVEAVKEEIEDELHSR